MATKTGSSYGTGTITDSVEIPKASPGSSTIASPNELLPSDCDNDEQPEMAMWPPKPEILVTDRMTVPTAYFRRYQYFRLVGCYIGFSTRGSVGHDCWTFRCFVLSH